MNMNKIKNFIKLNRYRSEKNSCYIFYSYIKPKIVNSSQIVKNPLFISKKLIDNLLVIQKFFTEYIGYDMQSNSVDQVNPIVLLLGQKNNVIVDAELVYDYGDGCGNMTRLISNNLSDSMFVLIKNKMFPAGLIRIGFFDKLILNNTKNMDEFGDGLYNLREQFYGQGLVFISLGKNSFQVLFMNKNQFKPYSYKIV